jgi:hypothetical protein
MRRLLNPVPSQHLVEAEPLHLLLLLLLLLLPFCSVGAGYEPQLLLPLLQGCYRSQWKLQPQQQHCCCRLPCCC